MSSTTLWQLELVCYPTRFIWYFKLRQGFKTLFEKCSGLLSPMIECWETRPMAYPEAPLTQFNDREVQRTFLGLKFWPTGILLGLLISSCVWLCFLGYIGMFLGINHESLSAPLPPVSPSRLFLSLVFWPFKSHQQNAERPDQWPIQRSHSHSLMTGRSKGLFWV